MDATIEQFEKMSGDDLDFLIQRLKQLREAKGELPPQMPDLGLERQQLADTSESIFDKIGKFDKNIFMYIEDMELCFRAKKQGIQTYFFPQSKVFHREHGSSSRSFAIKNIFEEILYFYKKHMPFWQYHLVKFILRVKATFLIILGKISGNSYFITTYSESLKVLR
ncbi:MAG: glycosyltransferase family 2 protein [Candidatus Levybacteria bacterium]|nr:glycosyltransferase family 2 protein [Candidatus Levybacteria bacterium]